MRASARVMQTIPELRVVVAGHGPDLEALKALSRHLEIDESVDFSGPYRLADLPRIYAGASVAVFPFRSSSDGDQDGLGLAVVEAMGCGVPVVGSDIAVLDDLLIPGVTALRAPTDDAEAFAAQIRETLGHPESAGNRATAARKRVTQRYDWTEVARRYAELLAPPVTSGTSPQHPAGS